MPFDEKLAEKVRTLLKGEKNLAEKKMFGGICFTLNGNMCCGVDRADLIVRVDPEEHANYLARPGARDFDLSGMKAIRGWLLVSAEGTKPPGGLRAWVKDGVAFARALPPKKAKKKPTKKK